MKKLLALLMACMLCLGLAAPALAGGEEDVSAHMEIEDGTAHQVKPLSEHASGAGWSYDSSTYTLTLNGFEGQYVRVYNALAPFTMVLADGSQNHMSLGLSVKTKAGFTITGGGSLDISGNEFGNIDVGDTLTVQSGAITSMVRVFLNGGKLHMTGGSLTVNGEFYGILGATYDRNDTCTITGGQMVLQGGRSALELSRDIASGDIVTGLENATFTAMDGSALSLKVTDEGASHFARLHDAAGNIATYAVITPAGTPATPVQPDSGTDAPGPDIAAPVAGFSDVTADAYYADAVAWAVENGITSGTSDTAFSPEETCTRGQIITFLWRAAGSPARNMLNPFSDVSNGAFYADAAVWAAEKGMASGSAFLPEDPCTRAMAVEFMWKQAGSPEALGFSAFGDVPTGASYASAVLWALNENVTSGTSETTFSPDDTCTRGQIVTFLYRAFAQ